MSGVPGIRGVAGVLIWTSAERYPAMLAFYRDVLRLPLRHEKADFVNFAWGDFRLSVAVHEQVHGPSADPLRVMVNFAVDDIHAAAAHLRAAGVSFLREPEREEWDGFVATFQDPDGNVCQLFQLP